MPIVKKLDCLRFIIVAVVVVIIVVAVVVVVAATVVIALIIVLIVLVVGVCVSTLLLIASLRMAVAIIIVVALTTAWISRHAALIELSERKGGQPRCLRPDGSVVRDTILATSIRRFEAGATKHTVQ